MPNPATEAATILHEWEAHAQPDMATYARHRPAILASLTEFCATLHRDEDINVDLEDVRAVLKTASSLGVARAVADGHNRATVAARLLLAALAEYPAPPVGAPCASLLTISSTVDAELEMDELSEIVTAVQERLGSNADMIFGHSLDSSAYGTELRLLLLVGYA